MKQQDHTWDWLLLLAIIVFLWAMGDSPPEFEMQYNTNRLPQGRQPTEFIQRQANFDHAESPNWDNPPDGPVPYDRIPEITQDQFNWRWGLPRHDD